MQGWVIIAIVAIAGSYLHAMYKDYLKHQRRAPLGQADRIAELEDHVLQLEQELLDQTQLGERVAVLEAIVTDPGYQLSEDIKALEGAPPTADDSPRH